MEVSFSLINQSIMKLSKSFGIHTKNLGSASFIVLHCC